MFVLNTCAKFFSELVVLTGTFLTSLSFQLSGSGEVSPDLNSTQITKHATLQCILYADRNFVST